MSQRINQYRRRFLNTLSTTGMSLAAARLGIANASPEQPRLDMQGDARQQPDNVPSLDGATAWLNSPPLSVDALRGKVVVVNFCTYTCINWLRSLPYVRAWDAKYRDHGLTTIASHTPEFFFEKNLDNVRRAVADRRITYPVAVDSDYAIWHAFDNDYWPALYFVDAKGSIRHHQFGEGNYDQAERVIQRLLYEAGQTGFDPALVSVNARGVEKPADWDNLKSPENYVTYRHTENFVSPGGPVPDTSHVYAAPKRLSLNQWALAGHWTMGEQATVLNWTHGRIACRFHARDLHLVMGGPSDGKMPVPFRVLLDGMPPGASHGVDVNRQGRGVVGMPRLYQLIRQPPPITDRLFEVEFLGPGVSAFVFTFG